MRGNSYKLGLSGAHFCEREPYVLLVYVWVTFVKMGSKKDGSREEKEEGDDNELKKRSEKKEKSKKSRKR